MRIMFIIHDIIMEPLGVTYLSSVLKRAGHQTRLVAITQGDLVDAVCLGEGELALAEFVEALDDGKLPTDVANFWVKDNGTIHRNPVRPLVEDLDTIPFPDREIFCHYAGKH